MRNNQQLPIKLYIQNMVCLCSKIAVAAELGKMDVNYTSLELGEVNLENPITKKQRAHLKIALHEYGFELMNNNKVILVEKIIDTVIKMIYQSDEFPDTSFSIYLAKKLNKDYHTLSTLFSDTKGITIEHFIILHKIERVKELIIEDKLSLSEISYQLNYSSAAHLSRQFKKITGLTPSSYKDVKHKKRINLENL